MEENRHWADISGNAIEIVYSYANQDKELLVCLEKHLSPLEAKGQIVGWHRQKLNAGSDVQSESIEHFNRAALILLLVSPDFLASPQCYSEMMRSMERHRAGNARVIPILLRPTYLKDAPFLDLKMLPSNSRPITKWSNHDEAFEDVVRGISQAVEDMAYTTEQSLPHKAAVRSAFQVVGNIPYPRNPFFTGREELLQQLHHTLSATRTAELGQPFAINGLEGIGKTQIAIEYSYRYSQHYKAVLWAKATTREAFIADFVTLAELLHLDKKDVQDQNIVVAAVKEWLISHTQWMLVLDDVDDLNMIRDFLPLEATGHVLLTTRQHSLKGIASRIEVEKMDRGEGMLLLLRRSGVLSAKGQLHEANEVDRATAEEIAMAVDGLPLALNQAGAYIDQTGCGLSEYLDLYLTRFRELIRLPNTLPSDYRETVATTWSLSFQRVEKENKAAGALLRLCAFLAPYAIPEEIISKGAIHLGKVLGLVATDALKLNEAMEVVQRYSLVRRNREAKTLTVHGLVQAVFRDRMDAKTRRLWAMRAVQSVNAAFPEVTYENWANCQRYLLHAQACANLVDQYRLSSPEVVRLLTQAGWYLRERALYAQAEPLLKRALAIRVDVLGPLHPQDEEDQESQQAEQEIPEQNEVARQKKRLDEQQRQLEEASAHQEKLFKKQEKERFIEFGKSGISLRLLEDQDARKEDQLFVLPRDYQRFVDEIRGDMGKHILIVAGKESSGKFMAAFYLARHEWENRGLRCYHFSSQGTRTLLDIIADEKLPDNAVILFDEVFNKGQIDPDDLTNRYGHLNERLADKTNVWFIFTVHEGPILERLRAAGFPILSTAQVDRRQVLEKLIDYHFPKDSLFEEVRAKLLSAEGELPSPARLSQLFETESDPEAILRGISLREDQPQETLVPSATIQKAQAEIALAVHAEQNHAVQLNIGGQIRNTKAVKIFYCYARKDKSLRDELEKHLAALERSGRVITWHDRKILAGTEWKKEISNQLDTSDIILLLVSPSFIHSDYCYSIEMQRALERHRAGAVQVIPIILRPCDWKTMPIHALQALPEDGRPISHWRNRDDAFQNVVKGIRQVIDAFYYKSSYREESDREAKYNGMILCPYCLTIQELRQTATRCNNPKCGRKIPQRYQEKARAGNVAFLGTFGLSNHGKSAFLASLMQSAQAVHKIAPGSYFLAFDGDMQIQLNEWSERYRDGRVMMGATSPAQFPRPLVMSNNFPDGYSNVLVAYDLAGEALKRAGNQPEYVRALSKVNTIWYTVSLADLANHNDEGYSMASLFDIYQNAMIELHIPIKGKNILVVYTKADLLLGVKQDLEPLPHEVVEYLADDPYDQLLEMRTSEFPDFDADAYFAKMTRISDILLEYTIDFVDGGGAFVSMVRDAGMQVYFTSNSAYGSALDSVRSVRVLDALIWAIKLNSGK
jgi:hypothetical protein